MQFYIITLLLFLLPLFIFPFGTSFFEIPKVILAESGIAFLFFLSFFKQKKLSFNFNSKKYWPFFLIFALTVIDLIFFNKPDSFFGNSFRLQGIFLLWSLLIFSVISSTFKIGKLNKTIPFISLFVLFITSLILGGNENGRAFGTLGEPNSLAAVAVFLWPFILFSDIKKVFNNKIPAGIIAIILAGAIVFLSGSRSGFIAISLQLLFLVLNKYFKLSFAKSTMLCLILVAVSLFLPLLEKGGIYESRIEVWQTAFISGFNSPIIGQGFGNITESLKDTSIIINNNVKYQFIDSSHNFILDWWVAGGILGVILILYLIFQSFRTFTHNSRVLEATLFLGVLTTMLFNPVSVVILLYFWFLVGQSFTD